MQISMLHSHTHNGEGGGRPCYIVSQPGSHAAVFHPLAPDMMNIHRRLKEKFDPMGILNPGRMYPNSRNANQISLTFIKDSPEGQEAEAIIRTCVHCGFCLATCPTYQLLGDELDSPRGRIYLMKQMLEGEPVTQKTQLHLDRCLTCRACETVCPSGVRYGRLVDIGRGIVEKKVGRSVAAGAMRYALRQALPNPGMFAPLLKLGQGARPLLPVALKDFDTAACAGISSKRALRGRPRGTCAKCCCSKAAFSQHWRPTSMSPRREYWTGSAYSSIKARKRRLLRCDFLPSECSAGGAGLHAPQRGCLVALC